LWFSRSDSSERSQPDFRTFTSARLQVHQPDTLVPFMTWIDISILQSYRPPSLKIRLPIHRTINSTLTIRGEHPLLTYTNGSPCKAETEGTQMTASTAIEFICDTSVFAVGKPDLIIQLPPGDDEAACAFLIEWRTHVSFPPSMAQIAANTCSPLAVCLPDGRTGRSVGSFCRSGSNVRLCPSSTATPNDNPIRHTEPSSS
jgi:hypothetical protein